MIKTAGQTALFIFALALTPFAAGQEGTQSLTLEDCILNTLQNNLHLSVQVYNPDLAEVSVAQAKEKFMPRFDLSYSTSQEESPSTWWIQGSQTILTDSSNYSLSVNQLIPTGGTLSLSMVNFVSDTNQAFQLINPYYRSTLRFDFSQPLLRDFGFKMSLREILIAQNSLEMSQSQFETVVIETVYSAQEAYWNLVYSIENLEVKQQSLELARDLLAKNRKEVEVGKLAELEILNAETVVAQREADILQAEAQVQRSQDVLKNILNMTDGNDLQSVRIVPVDRPAFRKASISLEESLKMARQNRPDLKSDQINMSTKALNLSVAKNQMLPGLDLTFSYWSPGVSGVRVLYLDDNAFTGIVVGKEEGSATDSLKDAFGLVYKNWSVGLTLSIPLSNVLSRAEYARAKMDLEKSALELEETERQILLEVRDAVREVETRAKQVEAYRIARELAERRLAAEEKKLGVGLTTNYFVLEYQEQLANARSVEILALVDYNLSLARLDRAVGTSLKKWNIQVGQIGEDR